MVVENEVSNNSWKMGDQQVRDMVNRGSTI